MKIVIGLSGGMDSATLLGILLEQGYEVHCVSFTYGSKHGMWETMAAQTLYRHYDALYNINGNERVHFHEVDLTNPFRLLSSNLLKSGEAIPEGHYNEEVMKKTVVPGRNMLFASVMAALAESIGAQFIGLGVHQGDHHIYPDCRIEFIEALNVTINFSSDGAVSVITPLLERTKAEILEVGLELLHQVPYRLTRTCYKDQFLACGKCGSCVERLAAFALQRVTDPIQYE